MVKVRAAWLYAEAWSFIQCGWSKFCAADIMISSCEYKRLELRDAGVSGWGSETEAEFEADVVAFDSCSDVTELRFEVFVVSEIFVAERNVQSAFSSSF